jgi:hypothetical protein
MRRKSFAPSVSVSEMETEASVTAMAEQMERVRDLPGESEDDDMGDDESNYIILTLVLFS